MPKRDNGFEDAQEMHRDEGVREGRVVQGERSANHIYNMSANSMMNMCIGFSQEFNL
jgi:hypothetical protein